MENLLLHEYIIHVKGVKKKVIYHFSDSHLTEYDNLSDDMEKEKAIQQTAAWLDVRSSFTYAHNEPYGDAQKQSAKMHFENIVNAVSDGDAVVVAGDTMDYINGANLRLINSCFSKIPCPIVAVCGNHEQPENIPDGNASSVIRQSVQKAEFDDMIILGFDNSKRLITDEQIAALNQAIETQKPTLIAMHVPIMTNDNEVKLRKAGEYFQLNYDGCHENNLKFIQIIRENSDKIIAVLAGHLHFLNVTDICDGVTQYVSSQGITGNLNKYIIGE